MGECGLQVADGPDADEGNDNPDSSSGDSRASPAAVQAAVCSALKWLVVNEEICKAFAEEGGVRTAFQARFLFHLAASISLDIRVGGALGCLAWRLPC